jgi:uroporphyrinogen III methyltransferase/synthase
VTSAARVFLVGAGPGDPGLLTRRGAEVLGRAEVVIYDGLVNPELLRLAPPSAEIIYGGKHDRTRAVCQEELNALLLARARAGKRVVRLKGGDPYVLGRGGEEAELLADAGIPFEVVPGVSSIEGVTCYAGIPLTHRAHCSGFTVVTGHESYTAPGHEAEWNRWAQTPGTLVILMGLRNLRELATYLAANGRAPDTPVAVISWGTTSRQRTVVGVLADIADRVAAVHLQPPAITVVGEVVRLREKLNWFERRPLFGQRVVITQRQELAQPVCAVLRELGAHVLEVPATRFLLPENRGPLDRALAEAPSYDWIVFSNPWVVDRFLELWLERHQDLRGLAGVRLGTFGPMTGDRVRAWRLHPAAVAADHKADLIHAAMTGADQLRGRRLLVLRAEGAGQDLIEPLRQEGARVDDVAAFRAVPETEDTTGDAARLVEGGADWLVFASGLAIEHFHHRLDLPKLLARFPRLKVALASPTIRWAMAHLGLKETVVARPNDIPSLVEELLKHRQPDAE